MEKVTEFNYILLLVTTKTSIYQPGKFVVSNGEKWWGDPLLYCSEPCSAVSVSLSAVNESLGCDSALSPVV